MKKIFSRVLFVFAATAAGFIIFTMTKDRLLLPEKQPMTIVTGQQTDTVQETSAKGETEPDMLLVINREHSLEPGYIPEDLVKVDIPYTTGVTDEEMTLRKEAAAALEGLFKGAKEDKIELCGVSGYRSYDFQKQLYDEKLKTRGKAYVDAYVANPGQSEHQTGLAMDVGGFVPLNKSNNFDFGLTKEGKWLAENAWSFGFIIRYPKGREEVTGYSYEPWHIRYVGVEAAEEIKKHKLVLEEYVIGLLAGSDGPGLQKSQ